MAKPKVHIHVTWKGDAGPLAHPAFKDATRREDGSFVLPFYFYPGGPVGRRTQMEWAEDRLRHLRSWGVRGTIEEVPLG